MINLENLVTTRLKEKKADKVQFYYDGEMREILQEIILYGLKTETDFFNNNAFLGGTALRLFYNLTRFSKDLDFNQLQNELINWNKYINPLKEYTNNLGLDVNFKIIPHDYIYKLNITDKSLHKILHGKNIVSENFSGINANLIEIDMETSFRANNFKTEKKYIKFPFDCEINVFDIQSLFSGKLNACLTREITDKKTGKMKRCDYGRDWYDLVWYINKKINPNYEYLSTKLNSYGPWKGSNIEVNVHWLKQKLLKRIDGLELSKMNDDIKLFSKLDDRIILTRDYLYKEINKLGDDGWGCPGSYIPKPEKENHDNTIPISCTKHNIINNKRFKDVINTPVEKIVTHQENKTTLLETSKYTNKEKDNIILEHCKKPDDKSSGYINNVYHIDKIPPNNKSAKIFVDQIEKFKSIKNLKQNKKNIDNSNGRK